MSNVEKIIVASTNPIKIETALNGFRKMFPEREFEAIGKSVASGVPDQPMTTEETLLGAKNRALGAKALYEDADYWVGIEGGIQTSETEMDAFAWVVVIDKKDILGRSRTANFQLPPVIVKLIKEGKELGEADDIVFGRTNSKQANGGVGLLTHDVLSRTAFYEHAVILALVPMLNEELYKES
jgi:inosine/xanthosine triphosphatase